MVLSNNPGLCYYNPMRNTEERYVKNIDTHKAPPVIEIGDQGRNAEEAVIKFFEIFPGMKVRLATPLEDSGRTQIVKDSAIDIVGYLEGLPAIGLQITTTTDSATRHSKTADLLNRPFIRLPEMVSSDTAIPRSLVFIDAAEVSAFLADHDISKHPKLIRQIIESNLSSLKLDLMKTVNPKEQDLIQKLLAFFEKSKVPFEEKHANTIH